MNRKELIRNLLTGNWDDEVVIRNPETNEELLLKEVANITTAGIVYLNFKTNNKTKITGGRYATKSFTKDEFQQIVDKIEGRS